MEDALSDRLILDVLDDFKSLNLKETASHNLQHQQQQHYQQQLQQQLLDSYNQSIDSYGGSATGGGGGSNGGMLEQYNWEGDDDDYYYYEDNDNVAEEEPTQDKSAIQEKSIFILNHFIGMKKKYDTKAFKSRGMIVCSGRKNLLVYKKTIDSIIEKLPLAEQFDTIAAFSPFSIDGKMILESDVNVNGKYAHFGADKNRGIVKALQEDRQTKIRLLIVADKLQTGFDEPSLSMMYIDKKIKGANIVQTLSRLSRISNEKEKTAIVDFVNSESEIKQVFQIYSKSTTLNDLQGEANLISKLQVAAENIKEVYANERNTKSFAKSIQFHQSKGNKKYIEVENDIEDFLNIYSKLDRSEIADILASISYNIVKSVKDALDELREQQLKTIKENTSHYTIRVRIDTLTDLETKNTLELSHQNVDYDADFAASLWADKKSPSPEKKRESTIQRLKQTTKQLMSQPQLQQQHQQPQTQQQQQTLPSSGSIKTSSSLMASSSFSYNAFGSTDVKKPAAAPINRSVSVWSMAKESNLKRPMFQPQFQPSLKKQKEET
ncbi:helicase superfamily 1 and 2 domain-containing protein [Heterostelium album PN500]|uniref:Helicase superfamily 1 and 2 domain-containing protein n=1 Tax=Heterostelium pallidum (strain ATCC 26659 / Pp 5 / PN500) TaxID=670386 RepID=D3B1F2_HETP5|nr:helicase superfamily 1 and 2 domain-containing protein [Heterostelium album PN500]EFA85126.1 helicase superfamily 1 and 2 domain-containing protein [Heterostelium album PN500]|eukprot:XP_020437235.1 helicase superfamily 1 and 2 domain-containing protein [Heterostelium album PN500]